MLRLAILATFLTLLAVGVFAPDAGAAAVLALGLAVVVVLELGRPRS
jgi:hypothetical protein